MHAIRTTTILSVITLIGLCFLTTLPVQGAPMPGAIWTTDSSGSPVNGNLYASKEDVYLNGGPANSNGGNGLPDGAYYVQVTAPDGTLLGTSIGAANETPFTVTAGVGAQIQIWSALIKASDSTTGYDDTTNAGGEYKVWVSQDPTFPNSGTKTDNFKVETNEPPAPVVGTLQINKFYDVNVDSVYDQGTDILITGWQVTITDANGNVQTVNTPFSDTNFPVGTYTITEKLPVLLVNGQYVPDLSWIPTTEITQVVTVTAGGTTEVWFGNVQIGPGGGLTLGFWSNKNGAAVLATAPTNGLYSTSIALLTALNLRNANGTNFDPANIGSFQTWLLNANATNMANMLSAQLAAMELNVAYNPVTVKGTQVGGVGGNAMVYAPALSAFGLTNAAGFISISDLMAAANTLLGTNGSILSGDPLRAYAEALKNALDSANNNKTFVQPAPGPFMFEP